MGVSGTVANGAAQTNRTDETTTTAKAALRSRREAGMVERKMLRLLAACTDLSSKLASTRHLSHRQTTGFAAPAYLADWSIAAAPGVTIRKFMAQFKVPYYRNEQPAKAT